MKFNLKKFLSLVRVFGPLVLANVPNGENIGDHVETILGAIEDAEQIKGATGPEKKAHVLEIVDAAVKTANATGKTHLDPAVVQIVAGDGIDAVVGTIKVIEGQKVVVKPPPSGPSA